MMMNAATNPIKGKRRIRAVPSAAPAQRPQTADG